MKLMRLAMVAAFAVAGGIAVAEDYVDIGAMQAKLAAQEARLNDLQAKIYGDACGEKEKVIADGLTSLRKNAVLTIGGTVNTRYYTTHGEVESTLGVVDPNDPDNQGLNPIGRRLTTEPTYTAMKWDYQRLWVSDAKLEVKIDVNDYFDAYLKMDLQGGDNSPNNYSIAENYWVRWKNICNSGFGVLVGRDGIAYGTGFGAGGAGADNWNLNYGGITGNANNLGANFYPDPDVGADQAMFLGGSIVPTHNNWDWGNTTQIKPYWEGANGRIKFDASIFGALNTANYGMRDYNADSEYWYGKSINFGLGSFTARATVVPVDGLTMSVSYMNLGQERDKFGGGSWVNEQGGVFDPVVPWETTSRSQGIQAGIQYQPVCFNRLKVWANYGHGWDDYWIKDYKSDTWSFGVQFGITDQLTWYGYGDLLYVKNGQGVNFYKANGWAVTTGLQYTLPYGINAEVGYRHESMKYQNDRGVNHTKYRGDLGYAHLGFNF